MKAWNNNLYNLVGIIKLSLIFQDRNTIDDILLFITKLMVLLSRLCLFFHYWLNDEVVSLTKFLILYVKQERNKLSYDQRRFLHVEKTTTMK